MKRVDSFTLLDSGVKIEGTVGSSYLSIGIVPESVNPSLSVSRDQAAALIELLKEALATMNKR